MVPYGAEDEAVGLGLEVTAAFSYGGWRWWKARRARRWVTDLTLPKPLLTGRERRP